MKYLLILLVIIVTACSLERNNPLDPGNNPNINVPRMVSGLAIKKSSSGAISKFVELEWEYQSDVAGYYLYRGLFYNGVYLQIADHSQVAPTASLSFTDNDVVANTYYYYKISAYSSEGLEGPRTSPRLVKVE